MTSNALHNPRLPRRALDGVLLLDKPANLSSNHALMEAKRLFNARKAGHTGTLDPLASGLLPLCFGEATKFSQDLLDADKTYQATLKFGVRTTTGDAEGERIEARPVVGDRAALEAVLASFRGEISQLPPMYSALKHNGRPLYDYARAGQTVERKTRRQMIHALDLIDCRLPAEPVATIRVACSKGTYIRVLAEDIGAALGCGAHLIMLRRTGVGALTIAQAVTLNRLHQMDDATRFTYLQPVDMLLQSFVAVRLAAEAARRFSHGQRLRLDPSTQYEMPMRLREAALAPGETPQPGAARVRVYAALSDRLLGTAHWREGILIPERLIAAATD